MTTQPSAIITQQAHILRQLGVIHWVQTNTPVMVAGLYADRFVGKDTALSDDMPNNDLVDGTNDVAVSVAGGQDGLADDLTNDLTSSTASDDLACAAPASATKPSQPAKTSNNPPDDIKDQFTLNNQPDTATSTISYELEGVRVGEWVLVVDVAGLGRDEQSIWVSLTSALSNWAGQNKRLFDTHRIGYPMSDELNRSPILAQKCFDGFVLRLQMMGDFAQKVAFLGELPDGVDYFGETVMLPTLVQMSRDANHKRQLWQQLTA